MGRTVEDACPYKSKGFADEILLTLVGEGLAPPDKIIRQPKSLRLSKSKKFL